MFDCQGGLLMEYFDEGQDSESLYMWSTMANKPDYKSFKFIDNNQGMRVLNRQTGNAEVNSVMAREDPVNGAQYCTSPSESEDKARRKIYIKKNVVDSYFPEMVTFFQDNSNHFVKDIFMDRMMHCEDDCSVENCELDHNSICSILNLEENSSESNVETSAVVSSFSNESKLVAEDDCRNDVGKQHVSEKLGREDEEDFDERDGVSIKKNIYETRAVKKEEALPNSMVLSTTEAVEEVAFESAADTAINNIDASIRGADCQQTMYKPEDGISESLKSSGQSLADQHVHRESISVAADLPWGAIKCPGPIPYCGSFAHRSSSSTSSSHSFAFPILPPEWIGSPARMASADRQKLRKDRRWILQCLCCKF